MKPLTPEQLSRDLNAFSASGAVNTLREWIRAWIKPTGIDFLELEGDCVYPVLEPGSQWCALASVFSANLDGGALARTSFAVAFLVPRPTLEHLKPFSPVAAVAFPVDDLLTFEDVHIKLGRAALKLLEAIALRQPPPPEEKEQPATG